MLGKANACLQQAVSFFWTQPFDIYLYIFKKVDISLEIDSKDWLRAKLHDKRDDLNFPIVNFPFIISFTFFNPCN
jgi:hypothetical protein